MQSCLPRASWWHLLLGFSILKQKFCPFHWIAPPLLMFCLTQVPGRAFDICYWYKSIICWVWTTKKKTFPQGGKWMIISDLRTLFPVPSDTTAIHSHVGPWWGAALISFHIPAWNNCKCFSGGWRVVHHGIVGYGGGGKLQRWPLHVG